MTERKHLHFQWCLDIQLHFDQACYIQFPHWFLRHFQSPSFHRRQFQVVWSYIVCVWCCIVCWRHMCWSDQVLFRWKLCHLFVTLKCLGCFSVNLEFKILHKFVVYKSIITKFFLVTASSLKILALNFDGCSLPL